MASIQIEPAPTSHIVDDATAVSDMLAQLTTEDEIRAAAGSSSPNSVRRASQMLADLLVDSNSEPATETMGIVLAANARSGQGSAVENVNLLRSYRRRSSVALPSAMIAEAVHSQSKCEDGTAAAALAILNEALNVQNTEAPEEILFNTTINACAKCSDGTAATAQSVLSRMRAAGVPPNRVTFNSMIDVHARCSDGSAVKAKMLLEDMVCAGFKPDLTTFTSVINLQARLSDGSAAAALEILEMMRPAGVQPNTITLNAVVDAQAKQCDGRAATALQILESMRKSALPEVQPNVVTYTSVIDCCAKCDDGSAETATRLVGEMCESGLAPNNLTFGTVLNAQARRGSAAAAGAILQRMRDAGMQPNAVAYNSVLNCHAKCTDGSAGAALVVLADMRAAGITPSIITYTAAIDTQAKCADGSAETAAQLFEEALEQGLQPDIVTCTGVLDAQAKRADGTAQKAEQILLRMCELDCLQPNLIHFNSVLNACANERPSNITVARRVHLMMKKRQLGCNEYTLSALLRTAAFSQPAEPVQARKWFVECAPDVELNDHVERALFRAVSESEATKLLSSFKPEFAHTKESKQRNSSTRRLGSGRLGSGRNERNGSWRRNGSARSLDWRSDSTESGASCGDDSPPTLHRQPSLRRRSSHFGPGGLTGLTGNGGNMTLGISNGGSLSPGAFGPATTSGGRRPSLGGSIAENTERDTTGSTQAAMSGLLGGGVSKLGRRLSLAEKVKLIRGEKASPASDTIAESSKETVLDEKKENMHCVSTEQTTGTTLLTPSFFMAKTTTPPSSPNNVRKQSTSEIVVL